MFDWLRKLNSKNVTEISCKALKTEIKRRQDIRAAEIAAEYEESVKTVKNQFRAFKELNLQLPDCLRVSDVLRYGKRDSSDYFYQQYRLAHVEYFTDTDTCKKVRDMLNMPVTPSELLEYWEQFALNKLQDIKEKKIRDLYRT